jgi:ABC-2 type transport system permease protein
MTSTGTGADRFPAGTFTPDPRPAAPWRMLATQARIETLLFLRHGEQQLLSLVIPVALLIAMSLVPVVPLAREYYMLRYRQLF